MRQLYYAVQTLLRGRGSNIIKIVSLTLGLFVGILLFAMVAFQLSFHKFFRQPEQLYMAFRIDNLDKTSSPYTYGTLGKALRENFPGEVIDATVMRDIGTNVFYNGSVRLMEYSAFVDEHFFSTLGLKVIAGKSEELATPGIIFVSRSLARKISGSEDPFAVLGKVVYADRKEAQAIKGVFEDIPQNSNISLDVALPMANLWKNNRAGWGFDISYMSIVRFADKKAAQQVQARLPELLKKYMPDSGKSRRDSSVYLFRPLLQWHTDNPTVQTMVWVMSVLAIALLLLAAFNYILISVSSLARRAKAVGVHKCSGATERNIFSMFLTETAVIVSISLCFVALLFYLFRESIEEITATSLTTLFAWNTLWVPMVILFGVFVLAGVIPSYLFASIPVTQVFRRYTERKTSWKRPLLFIQFMGVTFILGFLVVVFYQYRTVMNKDLGYNPDRVVMSWFRFGNEQGSAKSFFENLSMVEEYAVAGQQICYGYSGDSFDVGEGRKINVRMDWVGKDFIPMMGIKIVKGRNLNAENEAVVNEEFVRQVGWTDDPIGKQLTFWDNEKLTVVGVAADFAIRSAYYRQDPVLLKGSFDVNNHYLRLKEPFQENLNKLNKQMAEVFPTEDVVFYPLRKELDSDYTDIRRFRGGVLLASLSILLIALMGLQGYVKDEVRLRSKEIAIRKVNGANAGSIMRLLVKDTICMAIPAVVLGSVFAYFLGKHWLDTFAQHIQPSICLFGGAALLVLLICIASILIQTWHIANENPVASIKNE